MNEISMTTEKSIPLSSSPGRNKDNEKPVSDLREIVEIIMNRIRKGY
jgi:hypothetical protein